MDFVFDYVNCLERWCQWLIISFYFVFFFIFLQRNENHVITGQFLSKQNKCVSCQILINNISKCLQDIFKRPTHTTACTKSTIEIYIYISNESDLNDGYFYASKLFFFYFIEMTPASLNKSNKWASQHICATYNKMCEKLTILWNFSGYQPDEAHFKTSFSSHLTK